MAAAASWCGATLQPIMRSLHGNVHIQDTFRNHSNANPLYDGADVNGRKKQQILFYLNVLSSIFLVILENDGAFVNFFSVVFQKKKQRIFFNSAVHTYTIVFLYANRRINIQIIFPG